MSINHGETEMQKPISEYAKFMKGLLPADMPDAYSLKPRFEYVASEETIRKGVAAFRDFLYLFYDRVISDGHLYSKPQQTKNPADYPFLHNINHLLIDIGYHGKLVENSEILMITEIPSFTKSKNRIPVSKQADCLRFLALCGFRFTGIDLEAKTLVVSEKRPLAASYPDDPVMLTGLKALSIADMELRADRRYSNDDNLLRCDYSLLNTEEADILDVLRNYLHPLPEEIRSYALGLHKRYTDMGMVCAVNKRDGIRIAYSNLKKSQRVLSLRDVYDRRLWEFAASIRHGYCIVVRTKKTDKYADVIENFPLYLQEKIRQGYGCDRKLRNERCQGGCQGIRIPLDDSILDIKHDIEILLDSEMPDFRSV